MTLEQLDELLQRLQYQKEYLHQMFRTRLTEDYRLEHFPAALNDWYTMDYAAFRAELDLHTQHTITSSCTIHDWLEYFAIMQEKAHTIDKHIDATMRDIDQHKAQ